MDYFDIVKIILIIPFIIAFGIAMVFISYVIVPAMIVLIIGFGMYTAKRLSDSDL